MTFGQVVLVMRVFDGPTWDQSTCRGQSLAVTNSIIEPPGPPDATTGLTPFHVNCLPDPPWPRPSINLVQNGSFEDPSLAPWLVEGMQGGGIPPGHVAYHQAEGHLTAYEQVSFPPGAKKADYCMPCQLVAARVAHRLQ
jgi:hypothetical protein